MGNSNSLDKRSIIKDRKCNYGHYYHGVKYICIDCKRRFCESCIYTITDKHQLLGQCKYCNNLIYRLKEQHIIRERTCELKYSEHKYIGTGYICITCNGTICHEHYRHYKCKHCLSIEERDLMLQMMTC